MPLSYLTDVNGDAGHLLAGVVVQVAGNPGALGFLGGNEPAGELTDSRMAHS
jgi:hypothetical protein